MPGKLLKRKTSRNNKIKKPIEKDFDLSKFKEQINKELSRFKNKSSTITKNLTSEYDKRFKLYITDFFSLQTLMLINRIFHDSKKLSRELRNHFSLHSIFTKAIRQLLMNEFELIYFSIYLDIFGWRNNNYEIMEYFLITGFNVKKNLNNNINYIEEYLNLHYKGFSDKYNNWINNIKDKKFEINFKSVNEKYCELKRPYNPYCKNNFIDYNGAVDRILHMSLPYNENSKHQENKNIINTLTEDGESQNKKKKFIISFKVEKPPITYSNINNNEIIKNIDNNETNKNVSNNIENINNIKNKDLQNQNNLKNNNNNNKNNNNSFFYPQLSNNENNINNFIQHQNSNINNINYSLFNVNLNNLNNQNNFYQNHQNLNHQNELIKQQSELVYNDSALLFGKTSSEYNQSLFPRNSIIENPYETLQELFFNPIDLKQNLSINSYAGGEFKQNDNNNNIFNLNLNKMISNNGNNSTKIAKIKSNSNLNNLNSINLQLKDNNDNSIGLNFLPNQNMNNNTNVNNNNFNILNINQSNNAPNITSQNYSLEPPAEKKNFLSLYHNLANNEKKFN